MSFFEFFVFIHITINFFKFFDAVVVFPPLFHQFIIMLLDIWIHAVMLKIAELSPKIRSPMVSPKLLLSPASKH